MTEAAIQSPLARLTAGPRPTFEDSAALTQKRYRREGLLKGLGIGAIALALGLLGILLFTIIAQGWPAFREAYVKLDINFDPAVIDPQGTRDPGRHRPGQLRRPDQRQPRAAVPGRHEPPGPPHAARLRQLRCRRAAARDGAGRPVADRPDQGGLAGRRRRGRPVRQGCGRPRRWPRPTAGWATRRWASSTSSRPTAGWRPASTASSSPPAIRASPSSPASTAPCGARPT